MIKDWWEIPKLMFAYGGLERRVFGVLWLVCYPFVELLMFILGILFGLVQLPYLWNLARWGSNARISESGVEVFSKRRGHIASYDWSDISQVRRIFEPPGGYWELVLENGMTVPLHIARLDVETFRQHGIVVHEERKFRHEYEEPDS